MLEEPISYCQFESGIHQTKGEGWRANTANQSVLAMISMPCLLGVGGLPTDLSSKQGQGGPQQGEVGTQTSQGGAVRFAASHRATGDDCDQPEAHIPLALSQASEGHAALYVPALQACIYLSHQQRSTWV